MGAPTFTADNSADMKLYIRIPGLHSAIIVPMNGQTTRVATGTGEPVELERINHIIIKVLRNRIAKIDRYSYHKHERWVYECY